MALAESSALEITAVRAFEKADRERTLWTDGDRQWVDRAAAAVVGEGGTPQAFLAERARLALSRIGERFTLVPRAVHALRWRPWLASMIVVASFAAGLAIDRIGDAQRINVLAPPVLGLLAWNLAVYALLALAALLRYSGRTPAAPFRRALVRLAGARLKLPGGGELGSAIPQLASDWTRLAGPLYAARAARILHLAAATLALGVLAGLYLRGIAFEYRASWESTFLDAEQVRRLLAVALAPGAALTGMALPGGSEIAAIRAPGGENAARWLHLMAATVAGVVIVPRLLLALAAWLIERHRARHLPLMLDEPYFQRLLRGFQGGPARVSVLPYSYTLPPAAANGLQRLVAATFGGGAALTIAAALRYGDEEALAASAGPAYAGNVIAVFNAAATPEREAHGAFLEALAARLEPAGALVALVDESAFLARGSDSARRAQRQRAWREFCAGQRVPCAFADLAAPTLASATEALDQALAEARR